MKVKILKGFSLILAPILILALMTCFMLRDVPNKLYTNGEVEAVSLLQDVGPFTKVEYKDEGIDINFLGLIPLKTVAVHKVKDLEVYPGGNSVGIRLSTEGVLVVGHSEVIINGEKVDSPAKKAGIEIGDVITKIDGQSVTSSKDLIEKVKNSKTGIVKADLLRDGKAIEKEITLVKEKDEEFKLGLWVRDSTAGVGTMTFYHEETKKYGALGHPVTDGDTNKPFAIKEGDLLNSSIISVRKGQKGMPGELKGIFVDDKKPIGNVTKNTQCGIFGEAEKSQTRGNFDKKMKVGFRDEITIGNASIITTLDEEGPKEYSIEITKCFEQNEPGPKSMLIKVTDPILLEKTGGIVQGMSGSPIIQNGKIIGAVTHVLINKPDVGYGIYIDWMLEDAGVIK